MPKVIPLLRPASPIPLEGRTDDDLMLLARTGVTDAFAALAGRYMARLVPFCAKMTGDRHAAEEIAQETWLKLWMARESYVPRGKFPVLLYTVARHRCQNHLRERRRRGGDATHRVDVAEIPACDPDDLDTLLEQERRERVLCALSEIPDKMREALLLRFSEGLAYEDIAKIVGSGDSTIRSRVHHGIKTLRERLEREPS
jgi:RNA polymerase sigma-70 factor, ECF subfamily